MILIFRPQCCSQYVIMFNSLSFSSISKGDNSYFNLLSLTFGNYFNELSPFTWLLQQFYYYLCNLIINFILQVNYLFLFNIVQIKDILVYILLNLDDNLCWISIVAFKIYAQISCWFPLFSYRSLTISLFIW